MKSFYQLSFVAAILLIISIKSFSQSNELQARSAYLNAEEAYQQKKYDDAITYLNTAKSKLDNTNTKIQYLLVKALKDAGKYAEAKKELNTYFTVTKEDNSDEQYLEMVKNIAILKDSIDKDEEKKKAQQIAQQEQERLKREQDKVDQAREEESRLKDLRGKEDIEWQKIVYSNNSVDYKRTLLNNFVKDSKFYTQNDVNNVMNEINARAENALKSERKRKTSSTVKTIVGVALLGTALLVYVIK